MPITKEQYGKGPDGREVYIFTLTNSNGTIARVTNYGAILVSLEVADRDGRLADVTLGFDELDGWVNKNAPYFGAIVGRCGNRIANGKFSLDGVEYTLVINNGPNHLHGGIKGFDKLVWQVEDASADDNAAKVALSLLSPDGQEGYPGNLTVSVVYSLSDDDELKIEYAAETDTATVLNLTNHAYWNLAGHDSGDILAHELTINADNYTLFDSTLIPTGTIEPVKGTPLDFTKVTTIGSRIEEAGGYDNNYVLNKDGNEGSLVARIADPASGRIMEVYTTEPGVQFYTANFLDGTIKGKGGFAYQKHGGFCLETQHFPDSPNKENFPSVVLRNGEKYTQLTTHKFLTDKK